MNGPLAGTRHPLIVMSHGTGGMALNSYDTAIALADAGFVVASVTHTGDNYRDQSTSITGQEFIDRPRHLSRVIDFMLRSWAGHGSINAHRIGAWGHSAGGATVLIAAGGVADLGRLTAFCQATPNDWGCQQARQRGRKPETGTAPISAVDTRIRAIVVAAPAISVVFPPAGLKSVKIPVQLWAGAEDEIVRNAPLIRSLLPVPPETHIVAHGGHFAYLSPCSELLERTAPAVCSNPNGFDRVAFLRGFHQSIIAFYRQRLR